MFDHDGIFVLDTGLDGPNVTVLAAVHGNEPAGVEAIKKIVAENIVSRGSVTFIVGNPKALEKNVRFIEADLNRMFKDPSLLSDLEKKSYEYSRAEFIKPILDQSQLVLDIHTVSNKPAVPFVIYEEGCEKWASKMPFNIRSKGWSNLFPGGVDNYVTRQNKCALTIECGQHESPDAIVNSIKAISRFLAIAGMTSKNGSFEITEQRSVDVLERHRSENNFILSKPFPDFSPVKKGELIGIDGTKRLVAPKDYLLIFAHNCSGPGQDAFILAEEVWQ